MNYRITWDSPACITVIDAADDTAAVAIVKAHPRGTTGARLCRRVPGGWVDTSEDGRPGHYALDSWQYVPIR